LIVSRQGIYYKQICIELKLDECYLLDQKKKDCYLKSPCLWISD